MPRRYAVDDIVIVENRHGQRRQLRVVKVTSYDWVLCEDTATGERIPVPTVYIVEKLPSDTPPESKTPLV